MNPAEDPQALLATALEKLLFLESRLEASEAARAESAALVERQREVVRMSRARLGEWQRRAVAAEAAVAGAERDALELRLELARLRDELRDAPGEETLAERLAVAEARAERWAREREAWLDRMIALERLRGGGAEGDELDLGAFIAELRAELLALRRGEERRPLTVSERPPSPDVAALVAGSPQPPATLTGILDGLRLPRPHRTLLLACGGDLDSALASRRLRAVERLLEARLPLLAPLVSGRLAVEPDARVRAAMVRYVALASPEVARAVLSRMRADDDARVRAAAVDALAAIDPGEATLSLGDAAAAVRRRALERLPRTPEAVDHLADALHDPDPTVRRVALLTLSGHDSAAARAALEAAAEFHEASLSAIARAALGRTAPQVPPLEDEPLVAAIVEELRSTLRGRSQEELVDRLGAAPRVVGALVERLLAAGRLTRRGPRLYLP
ncbi:MAG: hypothetical protein RL199_511 [Pseudomonadota bacterium]|jgi:hypothetical protein